jgi:dolichol-phosphate mannosyltransferase
MPGASPFRLVQGVAAAAVLARLGRGRTRRPPLRAGAPPPPAGGVSVIVPARDEAARLGPCLRGVRADPGVDEVLVVDDRSSDGTAEVARALGARVVAGRELPPGWVGKPWALQQGLEAARGAYVLCLDADTRPRPGLAAAMVDALERGGLDLLTAGCRFACDGPAERLLHPAMLATLVVRFGPAGTGPARRPARALANGQCLVARREALLRAGGFARAAGHLTDDVALARALAADGWRVGFEDAADLVEVDMHASAREAWREWGRSLAMVDATPPGWLLADLLAVWLVLGLPLPRALLGRAGPVDALLLAVRAALLPALARVYRRRGLAYWLSPLADPAVAVRLTLSALRPARTWRGRTYPAPRPGTAGRSGS